MRRLVSIIRSVCHQRLLRCGRGERKHSCPRRRVAGPEVIALLLTLSARPALASTVDPASWDVSPRFQVRLLPGQSDCVFSMYGTPGELESLRQLVQVMREQGLGNGFDPGPTPTPKAKPIFDYLASVGWPVICYPGCADVQIQGGRCVLGPDCLSALIAPFILCGATLAAPAADDFAWIRAANYVPSYARNDVQIWMDYDPALVDRELGYAAKLTLDYRRDLREDIRRVQELGRRLGKPVVINEVVRRPEQPFEFAMPILREEKIGWVFWELMFGKTQFTRDANSIQGLIYPDGTCRDAREVAAVMNLSVEEAKPLFPQPRPAPPPLAAKSNPAPRMLFGDDTRHGRPFAKDPTVLRLGERYLMYYSMAPSTNKTAPKGWAIGIAESPDLEAWKKVGEILPEQPCEQNGLVNGKALLLGGKVHLFYNSYGNGRNDALCHATSEDGLKFARNPSNPILHPSGDWNSGRAIDCDAFEFGGKLWLIYATRDPSMQTQMLVAATADLKSGFDRGAWTPVGDGPILKPELPWETRCIEAPSVIQRGDTLYLFYGGGYNNDPQQVGCATSIDGRTWTRLFREPLIPNGQPGDWNASETGHPGVFTDTDGRTYLFVQGNNDKGRTWFLSAYEIAWQGARPAVLWDSSKFPMKRPGPAAHSEDGIAFSAGWTCWRGHGPRGGGLHYANSAGATATWETAGGDVTLIHKVGPDCGVAQVLIDGQPAAPAEFDTFAPAVEWNHRRVLATNLPPGRHIVTLVVLGKKNENSSNRHVQIVEFER